MNQPTLVIPEPKPFDALLSLTGRVAVVTGGTRGIGLTTAARLAQAGAAVVVTGRGQAGLDEAVAQLAGSHTEVVGVQADAAEVNDAQRVVDAAVQRFGRLDILVNNAAVFQRCLGEEMTEQLWDQTLDTDLKGAFFTARAAALAMVAAGRGGRIISVLSLEAFRPTGMLVAYSAAKAGLNAVTKSLAVEFAEHQIRVNAVVPGATITTERINDLQQGTFGTSQLAPGAVKTGERMERFLSALGGPAQMLTRMPLGRPGFPDELATAILFLASDMASYISGACLNVDGAQNLR